MDYPFNNNENDWPQITVVIEVPVKQATFGAYPTAAARAVMRVTLADLAAAIRSVPPNTPEETPSTDAYCIMCGAAPGEPCTVIDDPVRGESGSVRGEVHFYRARKREDGPKPPFMAVKDEPPYYFDGPSDPRRADVKLSGVPEEAPR